MSVHEATWNRETKMHNCCSSKHSYHKLSCPSRQKDSIPGRMSDPNFVRVQDLKAEGLNSQQIATRLNLPLEMINDLFVI